MGKQVYELNQKQEKIFIAITENNLAIEEKLNELKELKTKSESLTKQQTETNLQIKSNEDFIKDEISKLNENYNQFGFSFECPNADTVLIKKDGDLIDGYVFNKDVENWEYNANLPYCQLNTMQRVQYFKNIENIFDTISKF